MITSRIKTDGEVGAQKCGTKLGNQLFHGVGTRTEPAREIAVEAHGVARPVHKLMKDDRVERFGCRTGVGADKLAPFRHTNPVEGLVVPSRFSTVVNISAKRLNEAINPLKLLGSIFMDSRLWVGPAVNLLGIKDERAFEDASCRSRAFTVLIVC